MQRSQLRSVLLYSYTQPPDSFGSARYIDFDEFAPKYIATQLLVWETVNGQRTNYYKFDDDWMNYKREFELVSNGFRTGEDVIDCFENKEKGNEVRKYYKEYEEKIKADSKRVTFAADKETKLTSKSINGRYEFTNFKHSISYETNYNSDIYTFSDQTHRNAKKYSAERYTTDMNNVLDNFDISVENGRLLSRTSGAFKVLVNVGMEAEIKLTQKDTDKCGILFLGSANDNETAIVYPKDIHREYYVYADGYLRMSSNQNRTIPNKTIEITRYKYVEGGSLINPISQNVITDSNGHFTLTIDCTDIVGDGQYFFMARFGGDDKYSGRSTNTSTKHENFIF